MTSTELYSITERKSNGIFYTPDFLSDFLAKKIVHYLSNKNNISVLDPACGDSVLLKSFANEAVANNISVKNIVGIDKDSIAIENSQKYKDISKTPASIKLINTDSLFPFKEKNSDKGWAKIIDEYNFRKKFDVIVSNPPWGSCLKDYSSDLLSNNYTLAKGQFDIYSLFVELIIKNLSAGGVYALIIPDSIFNQEQTNLRQFLIEKTTIHFIARLGEKIFPEINRACAIIIGSNNNPVGNHSVDCMRLSPGFKKKILTNELSLEEIEIQLLHKVNQRRFKNNKNYIFDIDLKNEEEELIEKIKGNSTSFKDVITSTRGAELSKKGIICKCSFCNKWMPYPKTDKILCKHCNKPLIVVELEKEKIITTHKANASVKLKVGEDLYRFTSKSKSWIDISKEGINYKSPDIYKGDKILVRKTGIGITAGIDYEESYTNQVVYILNLKPKYKDIISLEFVLSILNSRIITYYLIKEYGENEWRTHPYLTQTMLANLPFPKIDYLSETTIREICNVTRLIKNEVVNSQNINISKKLDLTIERFAADLFGLNERDYLEILKTLHSAEQLIPIKRLVNCSANEIFTTNGI